DALIDVLPMGQKDVLTPEQTQNQGEPDIEEDEDHRRDDNDDRHSLDEEPHGQGENGRADAVAPGVAEERLGPAEVERQKTEGRAGQRQCQEREVLLTDPRTDEGKPTAGDDGPFGDEAVEP